jgi:hypothetical protein
VAAAHGSRGPWTIRRGRATREDIFYCFRLLLGRSPNREEWDGHVAQAGGDLDAIVRSYMSSAEFSSRVETLSLGPWAGRAVVNLAEPWKSLEAGRHQKTSSTASACSWVGRRIARNGWDTSRKWAGTWTR